MGWIRNMLKSATVLLNLPIFEDSDDTLVVQKCPIPELHIIQGFVNHLFWNGLVKIIGRKRALLWPKIHNLVTQNYHGEVFEGNACRLF